MLTGQLWLCFPREENYTKIDPRRVQNRPAGGPKWPAGGLRAAFLCKLGPTWPPRPLGSRALGTLLALLEPSWGLLGRSWGVLGRSWAPLGGRFGPSRGLIWTIWAMFVAQREIKQTRCISWCFWASKASRRGPKSLQNRPGRPLGHPLAPKIGLESPS